MTYCMQGQTRHPIPPIDDPFLNKKNSSACILSWLLSPISTRFLHNNSNISKNNDDDDDDDNGGGGGGCGGNKGAS